MYYIYIYLVIHVLSSFPTYCFFILFIHLFSATLNLHRYAQALFGCGAQGLLSICGAWACHCSGLSLRSMVLNPCPLLWEVDS